ncbi:MAG: aminotransferase class I/II-fold pyridoxal phosphate-dependent enzyme [Spirochaetaceae bacterium]|nr:MAG: aminotransferase class I/II-fold pyridoxal phosphate-dependent enzyme [Spirochaetaceae bacterium]
MHALAQELNRILEPTICYRALSDFGRRIYFPKGIVAQTAEANQNCTTFNATAGMAFKDGQPMALPSIAHYLNDLSGRESVAYAPTGGVAPLRSAWLQQIHGKNPGLGDTPVSMPVVTPGLTAGVAQAADLFVNAGDVIIMPDMFWGNYRLMFEERYGARIVTFRFFDDRFNLNLGALEQTLARHPGKAVILLNFPNNPTGYSPTLDEARALAELVTRYAEAGNQTVVVTDDAYFGLFYETGIYEESLFSVLAGAHENLLAVKVDGATKEDFVWGFRIGFVTFGARGVLPEQYAALEKKLAGSLRSVISSSTNLGQHILLKALQSPGYEAEKREFRAILEARYRKIKQILAERTTGTSLAELPFNSGYFMTFKCNSISAEQLRTLLLGQKVGTIAVGDDYLRLAYSAVDLEHLDEFMATIFEAADKLDMS